jgi:hypothetical protein
MAIIYIGRTLRSATDSVTTAVALWARIVHLPSAILPANGNPTSQAPQTIPAGICRVSYIVTYTRGVSGGGITVFPLFGNGVEESSEIVIDHALTLEAPLGTQRSYLQGVVCPFPSTNSPIVFNMSFDVPPGMTMCRLLVQESGVPASPGTCAIVLQGSS